MNEPREYAYKLADSDGRTIRSISNEIVENATKSELPTAPCYRCGVRGFCRHRTEL